MSSAGEVWMSEAEIVEVDEGGGYQLTSTGRTSLLDSSAIVHEVHHNGALIASIHIAKFGDTANVSWINNRNNHQLGIAGVRAVRAQYIRDNPGVSRITGERVSGASAKAGIDVRSIEQHIRHR